MKRELFFLFFVALLFVGFATITAPAELCSDVVSLEAADGVESEVTVLKEPCVCQDCEQSTTTAYLISTDENFLAQNTRLSSYDNQFANSNRFRCERNVRKFGS